MISRPNGVYVTAGEVRRDGLTLKTRLRQMAREHGHVFLLRADDAVVGFHWRPDGKVTTRTARAKSTDAAWHWSQARGETQGLAFRS